MAPRSSWYCKMETGDMQMRGLQSQQGSEGLADPHLLHRDNAQVASAHNSELRRLAGNEGQSCHHCKLRL